MDTDAVWSVVSGVSRGMDVLDEVVIVEWEGQIWGQFEAPNEDGDGDVLFPNYFGRTCFYNLFSGLAGQGVQESASAKPQSELPLSFSKI